jgi:ribosome modulation factor
LTDNDAYVAYWDGLQREDNPYDPEREPNEHESWLESWCKAREHDYDESEG